MEMTGNFSPCGLEQKISVKFAQTWYDCFELHCVCNQIELICVVFCPGLVNFMTSSSFSCANSATHKNSRNHDQTVMIGLGFHILFSYLNIRR